MARLYGKAWPTIRIHLIWSGYFEQKRPTFCQKFAKRPAKFDQITRILILGHALVLQIVDMPKFLADTVRDLLPPIFG